MTICIYPKVNIFLKIVGFERGFHMLNSRFVLAVGALYDEMCLEKGAGFSIKGSFGCAMEDNLIYKAKCALQEYLRKQGRVQEALSLESTHIEVQKNIPQGAGLGGGSANAGAFLRGVNELYDLRLTQDELLSVSCGVGADVSFFSCGFMSANVSGKGERVESRAEKAMRYEIYTPPLSCDTTRVYKAFAHAIEKGKRQYSPVANQWLDMSSRDILNLKRVEELNDLFESACECYPTLKDIAEELGEQWYFSGSGSSFFKPIEV